MTNPHNDLTRSFIHTNPKPTGPAPKPMDGVSPHPPTTEPKPPQGGIGVQNGKRRPPEYERYDELKGKEVVVVMGVDQERERLSPLLCGVLRWVDRYTIGVWVERHDEPVGKPAQVWIVNKAKIVMIGEA